MTEAEKLEALAGPMGPEELLERVRKVLLTGPTLEASQEMRDEFAVALVLQGYEVGRAHRMAYETIKDSDGVLQMLARFKLGMDARARAKGSQL